MARKLLSADDFSTLFLLGFDVQSLSRQYFIICDWLSAFVRNLRCSATGSLWKRMPKNKMKNGSKESINRIRKTKTAQYASRKLATLKNFENATNSTALASRSSNLSSNRFRTRRPTGLKNRPQHRYHSSHHEKKYSYLDSRRAAQRKKHKLPLHHVTKTYWRLSERGAGKWQFDIDS